MHLILAAAVSAALSLSPAVAQEPQPAPEPAPGIVITGARDQERQVRDFVEALTPAPSGSIPRFIDEVCPAVVGLAPAQNEAVAERLRAVAEAAGLRVAGRGCAPNAMVIVTRDKRAFIEAMASRRTEAFGTMSAQAIRRLARSPGPAAAWHVEGPVDSDGVPLPWDQFLGAYRNDTFQGASRLRSLARRGFDVSALVVESGALSGLTTVQLADYAAMRLLARLDPERLEGAEPASILRVLTAPIGSEVPITITSWDLGLLRGLYATEPNLSPGAQRSDIARRLIREREAAAAGAGD